MYSMYVYYPQSTVNQSKLSISGFIYILLKTDKGSVWLKL